jgi:hydrogenase nickel incorporation protein HypA/HybF
MRHVVTLVAAQLEASPHARVRVVRLEVSALSHLPDRAALQATFRMAARGTAAADAVLDVIAVPVPGVCRACRARYAVEPDEVDRILAGCPGCGTGTVELTPVPEVVLHEIVVEE